jgi:hypothetical protein
MVLVIMAVILSWDRSRLLVVLVVPVGQIQLSHQDRLPTQADLARDKAPTLGVLIALALAQERSGKALTVEKQPMPLLEAVAVRAARAVMALHILEILVLRVRADWVTQALLAELVLSTLRVVLADLILLTGIALLCHLLKMAPLKK